MEIWISHYYICQRTCDSTSNHAKVGQKIQIKCVIFELISWLLSSLYLCNQESLLLTEPLILSLQNSSYFEHLIIKVQKSFICF